MQEPSTFVRVLAPDHVVADVGQDRADDQVPGHHKQQCPDAEDNPAPKPAGLFRRVLAHGAGDGAGEPRTFLVETIKDVACLYRSSHDLFLLIS